MMIMKKLILIIILLSSAFMYAGAYEPIDSLKATKQLKVKKKALAGNRDLLIEDTLTNEYLDTVNVRKKLELND